MTHIRKACLICDVCSEKIDIDPTLDEPFYSPTMAREHGLGDWLKVEQNHLCPKCAKAYNDKKEEMQAELDKLAGIRRI